MKRLLLLSLGSFLLLEILGTLSAKWLAYDYSYQTGIVYLFICFCGGWTFFKEKRLLLSWMIGIPIALLHINIGGPLAESFGIDVYHRDLPPSRVSVRLLDSIVRPPAIALWSLLGGFLYKVFVLEENKDPNFS